MILLFPEGFNYPIPRGWPLPSHDQPEEVYSLPWKRLNEVQKEHRRNEEQQKTIEALTTTLASVTERLGTVERQLTSSRQ